MNTRTGSSFELDMGAERASASCLAAARQRLPTLATFVIAVASSVVMTLAGCAPAAVGLS